VDGTDVTSAQLASAAAVATVWIVLSYDDINSTLLVVVTWCSVRYSSGVCVCSGDSVVTGSLRDLSW